MARSRLILALPLLAIGAAAAIAGATIGGHEDAPAPPPATEHVLLGAPHPGAGPSRGLFVRDAAGQIEHIAASGHLVAWSVRTPADRATDPDAPAPVTFPRSSKIVVVDERGGSPASVILPRRWVSTFAFVRDAAGVPFQLAILTCTGRARSSCRAELIAVATEPSVRLGALTSDPLAEAAVEGRIDLGRRLHVGQRERLANGKRRCAPPLSIETLATGARRALPPVPERRRFGRVCERFLGATLHGDFVLATVWRSEPSTKQSSSVDLDIVEILQLGAAAPRWISAQTTRSVTDYGGDVLEGTAFTPAGPVWQAFNSDTYEATTMQRLRLPEGLTAGDGRPRGEIADPTAPAARNGCELAATDDAIYELANPRCAVWPVSDRRVTNGIRRVVAPAWRPAEEW